MVYFLQKAKSQEVEEQENQGQFGIATELKKAEKFDDVVFAYQPTNEEEEPNPHFLFIQAKHKQDGKIPIKYKDLFSKSAKEPFQVTNILKDTPSMFHFCPMLLSLRSKTGAANAGPVGHSWPARAF